MKSLGLVIGVVLASAFATAETLLDCKMPKSQNEARICKSVSHVECAEVARQAVLQYRNQSPLNQIKVTGVEQIQEDASYRVKYVYARGVSALYTDIVYVSTNHRFCFIDSLGY